MKQNSHNMPNVPNLRFPGFEQEWQEKNIGDVFSIFNGFAFAGNDAAYFRTPWVKIADVGIQEMKKNPLSYLPKTFRTKYSKFLLKKGDFVVALTH